jgi:acid stress-induced BolA-like protein IbaG/YrbA
MAIQILSEPPPEPEDLAADLRRCIEQKLAGADVTVRAGSPGHFEIEVTCAAFEGLNRVKQQQKVYGAIQHLMTGDQAPVHAIDRMTTRTP